MKKHIAQLVMAVAPGHPDQAPPCRTPTARPRPDRKTAETELASERRRYTQTGHAIRQLEAYLATL